MIHKYASKSVDVNLGPLSVLKENGKLNLTNMGASALMTYTIVVDLRIATSKKQL